MKNKYRITPIKIGSKTIKPKNVFKEISKAYEILMDPQKRAAYDRYGEAAFDKGSAAQPRPEEFFQTLFG